MKSFLVLLSAAGLLAACSTTAAPAARATEALGVPDGAMADNVYAVSATRDGLRVRVPSNGCTTKADFKLLVSPPYRGFVSLERSVTVLRTRRDTCQSLVMGSAWIEFTNAELGIKVGELVTLSNPLTAWTGLGD